ncbi:protein of unknown function DUF1830 [Thalassoporum mexicanum PCC 7367]|uniref:DUF1830 domain-containing protein n=1 Tax=Thalassoporum mexicanum TaxID=3457544 RepID=UPI00029FF2F5|nr:DUF1830 domain-containing protein [Pseudanabaena sp. PCC 7367]AFY69143.1 protein of unknown function DUF1830 [Pseudanabaena sp. PCC 7367]
MVNKCHETLDCSYTNVHKSLQIVRISSPASSYFEKTVYPGQTVDFTAHADAFLEIYNADLTSTLRVDTLSCLELAKTFQPVNRFLNTDRKVEKLADRQVLLPSVG